MEWKGNNFKMMNLRKSLRKTFVRSYSDFDMKLDYYLKLGLTKSATESEIKRAFYALAKKYHPDIDNSNEEKFKDISNAYDVLSDPLLKKQYDYYNTQ